jgi:hypothetical protein
MTLPNFLIVGAAKAGTTTLYRHLMRHPDIYMPDKLKETFFLSGISPANFFGDAAIYANDAITSLEDYQDVFTDSGNAIAIGEACVAYLYFHRQTIPRIQSVLGTDCRIIISLRNPVDRAFSNYLHHYRDGFENVSFEEALSLEETRSRNNWWWGFQYRKVGLYADQVSAYLDAFGLDNVKIILSEDLWNNPDSVLRDIFRFLGVDTHFHPDTSLRFNVSGVPKKTAFNYLLGRKSYLRTSARLFVPRHLRHRIIRSPLFTRLKNRHLERIAIDQNTRALLVDYYRNDIRKLESLPGMKPTFWMATEIH